MFVNDYWALPPKVWKVVDWRGYFHASNLWVRSRTTFEIPVDWQINPFPPFLRPKIPFTIKNESDGKYCMVKGVKAEVLDATTKKKLGYCFFFDIDHKVHEEGLMIELETLMYAHNISHLVVTETKKGYHIWCLEYKKHKIGWHTLFMDLKRLHGTDYEFLSDWILRIGSKPNNPAPKFLWMVTNHDKMEETYISTAHALILNRSAEMSSRLYLDLQYHYNLVNTFATLLEYRSWNFSP